MPPIRRPIRPLFSLALLGLLLGASASASAQTLAPGTRVRVTVGGEPVTGAVARASADTLTLDRPGGGEAAFAWAEVERLEQSLGRRGRAGRGALVGAGVMGVATVASLAFDGEASGGEDWGDVITVIAIPTNMAVGAGLGALVGLLWRSERWGVLPLVQATPSAAHAAIPGARLVVRL